MAQIWIADYECEDRRLPKCCMVCGEKKEITYVKSKFSYAPLVALIALVCLGFIFYYFFVKTMVGFFPLCRNHKRYFFNRSLITALALILFIFGLIAVLVCAEMLTTKFQETGKYIILGTTISLFVGVFAAVIYANTGIKAKEIKDDEMQLDKVHPDFAGAVRADRKRMSREAKADDEYDDDEYDDDEYDDDEYDDDDDDDDYKNPRRSNRNRGRR